MTRIGVLAPGDGGDPRLGNLPRDVDAVVVGYFAPDEVTDAITAAGIPILWNASSLRTEHAHLVQERHATVRSWLDAHDLAYGDLQPFATVDTAFADALRVAQVARAMVAAVEEAASGATITMTAGVGLETLVRHEADRTGITVEVRPREGRQAVGRLPQLLARARRISIDHVDRNHRIRGRLAPRPRPTPPRPWQFSSYAVYSRVLGRITDPDDGWVVNSRAAAVGSATEAVPLWHFPRAGDPGAAEAFLDAVRRAKDEAPERIGDLPLQASLLSDPGSRYWLGRGASDLVHEADLIRGWLRTAQPTEVRLANQWGAEGLVIQACRQEGIATTQLQHGLLNDYYRTTPILSDRMFVWSQAWTDQVRAGSTAPDVGHGPPLRQRPAAPGRRVTYFTSATTRFSLIDPDIQRSSAIQMLSALSALGLPVAIRPHPADDLDGWTAAWKRSSDGDLVFDRRPLDQVLDETGIAICHFSTIVVDCAAAGVPTVIFEYHPFFLEDLSHLVSIETSIAGVVRAVTEGKVLPPSVRLLDPADGPP
ncbi:MAG: hypothetical protein JWN67_3673 [Actinomycetia bacterium]|nr:hypothetical protein [Actinomycetes bacterium]